MGRISAVGEVENVGHVMGLAASDVAEKEPQMGSDGTAVGEAVRLPKDQANQRRGGAEGEAVEEQVASSSGSSINCEQPQEVALFSPGFSSAVAKAGWDAEALLMAALSRSPVDSGNHDASQVDRGDVRKRDKHTPLSSSARRHRRVRLEDKNGSPLGRLPMKPLTLLSDNEPESIAPTNENCPFSIAAEGKENWNHNSVTCKGGDDVKGKQKEPTPTKPLCLDQLREELSCAVCLDICFEPATIFCGHSFCGTCLQSVLQKCGPKCPKCRQPLRNETHRSFRTNTVLWNTIQILFPKESAARIQDQQQSLAAAAEEEAATAAAAAAASRGRGGLREEHHHSGRYLGTRPARNQPWRRTSAFHNVSQTSVMATLRTSFQAASELMMPRGRELGGGHDDGRPQRQSDPPAWPSRETSESAGRQYSRVTRQTQHAQAIQEQVDAALAARLQQAELNAASSDAEDLTLVIEGPRGGSQQAVSRPVTTARPRLDALASAAAAVNLPSAARRAPPRQRSRVRTRS